MAVQSSHQATVVWHRGEQVFSDNRYSRAHAWHFDGGLSVAASSSPLVVPEPLSDPNAIDPEEAFVAALSSCHMLWFLSIAAKRGYTVNSYTDHAFGTMTHDSAGKLAITTVTLRPWADFVGAPLPPTADIAEMHHAAHAECFLANSVKCRILCEPATAGPLRTG